MLDDQQLQTIHGWMRESTRASTGQSAQAERTSIRSPSRIRLEAHACKMSANPRISEIPPIAKAKSRPIGLTAH